VYDALTPERAKVSLRDANGKRSMGTSNVASSVRDCYGEEESMLNDLR
jgi:hypothetical protein